MRYVDIAVAALIGTSAIAGVISWSPRSGDSVSQRAMLQSGLRDDLLAYLRQRGVVWLLQSSPEEVCADLSASSSPSVTLSAVIGHFSCAPSPIHTSVSSTLTLHISSLEVTLEAWSAAKA